MRASSSCCNSLTVALAFANEASAMIVGKRPWIYEEFHDHVKRYRLEDPACLAGCPSWASAEVAAVLGGAEETKEVVASALACSLDARRSRGSHCMEDSPQEPPEKRLRLGGAASSSDGPAAGSATIRGWAEAIVKALHGCPSVEEASKRCARVLEEVEAEVRQATLNEVERAPHDRGCSDPADERPPQEGAGSLKDVQKKNRILWGAVHHLAERCKRSEAGNEELVMLRQALEQSQDSQRRLQHSHEVLQAHLRLHLDQCSDRPLPWGNALH